MATLHPLFQEILGSIVTAAAGAAPAAPAAEQPARRPR
jgi:hypothetical protein